MKQQANIREVQSKNIEIDFTAFFKKIISLWYLCLIGLLSGALVGILYFNVFSTPMYESTSMVYLRSANKKLSLESLQLNSSLTNDYQLIFSSRPNLEKVIDELHLKYNVENLKKMITIENPDETRILQITVKSKSPKEARNIANSLVNAGMDDIREIDSQEPYVVEKGVLNTNRVGISMLKLTFLTSFAGLAIVIAFIFIKFKLNDSFTSSDDVEKTLGVPVLAVIAEDESLTYAKLESSNSRRRKHHGKKTSK